MQNPFVEFDSTAAESNDLDLVEKSRHGDRSALEELVRRHQAWIYNIALRMVWDLHEAEDVTQEVLIKVITNLGSFAGKSGFRTWLYRIVVNHVLNMRRRKTEPEMLTFDAYGDALDRSPDGELTAAGFQAAEVPLLVEEAKIGCMLGMLLCLDRRQRLVFTLGEVFGVTDRVGAELLEITPDNFRQLLARARRDLYNFMNQKCGLVNENNPCRCAKKTRHFIAAGYVDPKNLRFVPQHVRRIEELAPARSAELEDLYERRYAALFREQAFLSPADETDLLSRLLSAPELQEALDMGDSTVGSS